MQRSQTEYLWCQGQRPPRAYFWSVCSTMRTATLTAACSPHGNWSQRIAVLKGHVSHVKQIHGRFRTSLNRCRFDIYLSSGCRFRVSACCGLTCSVTLRRNLTHAPQLWQAHGECTCCRLQAKLIIKCQASCHRERMSSSVAWTPHDT